MTKALGDSVLDWMLRRLRQAVRIEHDLVIVHDGPALADVGPSIDVAGEQWRVARATGELTLRDAIPEADRLIAVVPSTFPPLPMDVAGRTYLGRILEIRAEDLIAAVSNRFCEALVDEGLAAGVFDSIDTLRITVGKWSLGKLPVTAREVRSVLVGAELGAARLDRERDWELLAHWILYGAPTFRAPTLVRAALLDAQPRTGSWLAWALTDGTLTQLCTAGALMGSAEGEAAAPKIAAVAETDRGQLGELVHSALREVWGSSPARVGEMLIDAERTARQVSLEPGSHRLLRIPLEGALSRYANACAEGRPPDDVELEKLKSNLHASDLADCIAVVRDLARLARFQMIEIPAERSASEWFGFALRHVAWADVAFRCVRRRLETIPAWLGDPARRVVASWVSRRDVLNVKFAEFLAAHWGTLATNSDARDPLPLHQISRCLLRRLVDDGSRILLLVLDGCDIASFLEILNSIPSDRCIGLTLPTVRDAVLRDDLDAIGPIGVAISPLPTVTNHARRGLFAGEIPGNVVLDDTESAPANAAADHRAWKRNTALGDAPRQLFLKGDLGTTCQPLIDALHAKDHRILAAVFNGVDDALSSKETTPLPAWSLSTLGAGAAEVLLAAIDEGWCVLTTADHGHTPFLSSDRKAEATGLGQRFSAEASDGTVAFRAGPLPRKPLHLLTKFGAWFGQQRRGFHGGAAIEEVAVPLAFLGRIRGEQEGRATAPTWWWSVEGVAQPLPRAEQRPAEQLPPPMALTTAVAPAGAPDPRLTSLTSEEALVVALLQQNQQIRMTVIAQQLKKSPMRASGFMQQLVRKLFELNYPCISVEVLPDGDRLYRYQQVGGGNR